MNTEDPNPINEDEEYGNALLSSLMGSLIGGIVSEMMKIIVIDYINIQFFWDQFWRYYFQTWVSIPNQKQFRLRVRNKSPP